MLVLTATNDLQGTVDGDYAHTVEGELVTPVAASCSDARCGCDRGFPGLASARATTTAMVVDLPHVTATDLRDAVHDSLVRGGWLDLLRQAAWPVGGDPGDRAADVDPEAELRDIVDEHVDAIAAVCAAFPVGTVVGRHGPEVVARSLPTAA